jgi:hypothetical protein
MAVLSKAVNIVKKRGTAGSVIAESVNVIKQRKEATAPLKFPLSLSRSVSVPLGGLSWQVVFEEHRCSASTYLVIRPRSGDGQRSSTNTGVDAGVNTKNSEYPTNCGDSCAAPEGAMALYPSAIVNAG